MREIKFGLVEWDAPELNNNKKFTPRSQDEWLRLSDGDNLVRVVTKSYQYNTHKYKIEGDPSFGKKIKCAKTEDSDPCPLCNLGSKVSSRWYVGVIDRKTQMYKILDMAYGVHQDIKKLVANTRAWGVPSGYDINIIVDRTAIAANYYTVQPDLKEPLSEKDTELMAKADIESLKRLCQPWTPEKVQEALDKYRAKFGWKPGVQETVETIEETEASEEQMPDFVQVEP